LLENWLSSREPLLHDENLGETIAQVDDLIRKHEDFEKTVQAQEEKFSALQRVTMVGSRFVCVCVFVCIPLQRSSIRMWESTFFLQCKQSHL
jgi:nitrate/nitrite-specific signal transduction histidine kinase